MKYGLPYKGSKSQIAEEIIRYLPKGKRLVDLFGGGGAISHCAALSCKWDTILYNEINPLVYKGFNMALNGEFKGENRWISHEEFFRLRDTDPYVAFCFSFSNDLRSYAYSREKEPIKKALHYARIFGDHSLLDKLAVDSKTELKNLERLESIERVQSLDAFQRFNLSRVAIETTNDSYLDYVHKEGDVVYCDPPYEDTWCGGYGGFNNEEFYKWVETRDYPVYFSTYEMPKLNDRFIKVWEKDKRVIAGLDNAMVKRECMYSNKETDNLSLIPIQLMLF